MKIKTRKTQKKALDNINLTIEKGEFVAVLGHNGSGKSTLAKLLNGILLPTSGNVFVNGINTLEEKTIFDVRRFCGMVFQNPDNQIVSSIVEEDVAFALENMGVEPESIRKKVDEALEAVSMSEYKKHAPHLLSGGQKQRIAIAGVLAMSPECIVLDEPTAMLDPIGRKEIMETIDKLNKERTVTVILITHDMYEASMADRIIVMNDGKIELDGATSSIFSNVEKLWQIGVSVPETVELIYRLNREEMDLPLSAFKEEDCANEIAKALR